MNKIFTIGHSNHTLDKFLEMLKQYDVNVLVDVRSVPFSRFAKQFNSDNLKLALKKEGVHYIHMGNLGGRPGSKELIFADGTVNIEKVKNTKEFQEGIIRIQNGVDKGYRIALMCAEEEALNCHRFYLISPVLAERGYEVYHIHPERLFSQNDLISRMLNMYRYNLDIDIEENLENLINNEDIVKRAFMLRSRDIAYTYKGK